MTIQLWLGGPGKQKDSDEVWELFNEKLQEYVPNTTVEITCMTTTEYPEKFDQMLASGEGVDLAWVASWVTGTIADDIKDGNLNARWTIWWISTARASRRSSETRSLTCTAIPKTICVYYLISWQGLYSNVRAFQDPYGIRAAGGRHLAGGYPGGRIQVVE